MKNAGKFLALGLSVCMLMGSVPAVVFAEDLSVQIVEQSSAETGIDGSEADADQLAGDEDEEGGSGGYSGLIDQGTVYDGTMNYDPSITYHVSGARELRTMEISGNGEWKGTGMIFSPDPAIMQYANVRNIVVNEGITNLPDCAFKLLEGIHHFTLPNSLQAIGSRAFQNSTRITELQIPDSVKTIGSHAFASTFKLQKLNMPKSLESVGDYAFYFTTSLEEIEIPSTKVKMGKHLFQYTGLKKLTLPGVIEDCPEDFFSYFESVEDLYFKGTKEEFYNWTLDYDVELAENCVLHFGENGEISEPYDPANYRIIGLEEKTEGSQEEGTAVTTYTQKLGCNREITWELSGSGDNYTLTFKGNGALGTKASDFEGRFAPYYVGMSDKIRKVVVEDGISGVGAGAFKGFKNLEEVQLPASLKEIGKETFADCESLKEIKLPEDLKEIPEGLFRNCKSLAVCPVTDGVETIGDEAFAGCENLKEFRVPSALKGTLGAEVFGDYDWTRKITKLVLPADLKVDNSFIRASLFGVPTESYQKAHSLPEHREIVYAGSRDEFYQALQTNGIFTIASGTELVFSDGETEEIETDKEAIRKTGAVNDKVTWTLSGTDESMTLTLEGEGTSAFDANKLAEFKKNVGRNVKTLVVKEGVTDLKANVALKSMVSEFVDSYSLVKVEMPTSVKEISSADQVWNVNRAGQTTSFFYGGTEQQWKEMALNSVEAVRQFTAERGCRVFCPLGDGGLSIFTFTAESCEINQSGTCGNGVNWTLAGNLKELTLSIKGNGRMDDYQSKTLSGASANASPVFTPERPWEKYASVITGVKVSGNMSIGTNAFSYFSSLSTVSIGNGVTRIGAYAFASTKGLKKITIPAGVSEIGTGAFEGSEDLAAVAFKDGSHLLTIGKNAFAGTVLTEVSIPSSVVTISSEAFACEKLTTVTLSSDTPFVAEDAFGNARIVDSGNTCDRTFEENVTGFGTCGDKAFWQASIEPEEQEEDPGEAGEGDQPATQKDYKYLFIYGKGDLWDYQPLYTEKGKNTYAKSKNVRENGATYSVLVADGRPWVTNINRIRIGKGIAGLGEYVFAGMTSLTEVQLPESLERIDKGAFINCKALTKIEIGKNVKSIGAYAFYNCTALTDIYYDGSKEEWKEIVEQPEEEGLYTYDTSKVKVHFKGEVEPSEEKADESKNARVFASNLSLRESIGIHTYLKLSGDLMEDEGAFALVTPEDGGEPVKILLKDLDQVAVGEKEMVDLYISTYAKQLHDRFTVRLYDGSGKLVTILDRDNKAVENAGFEISAADCCETALANKSLSKEYRKALNAVLNYGIRVQRLLGYKSENLKDIKGLGSVRISDVAGYDKGIDGTLPDGLVYSGANLEMKENIDMIFYFKAAEGLEDQVVFSCDNETLVPERSGEYLILRLRNIKARDLGCKKIIAVNSKAYEESKGEKDENEWSLRYGAYTYVYDVLNSKKTSKELKEAAKAVYLYGRAIVALDAN